MRLRLRRGSQPAAQPERMAYRVRWRVRQYESVHRQLAIAVQEPLHHREGPYALGSRLDRERDSNRTGARPPSKDRRCREKTKKGPLVGSHLGLVQQTIAVHLLTAPRFRKARRLRPPPCTLIISPFCAEHLTNAGHFRLRVSRCAPWSAPRLPCACTLPTLPGGPAARHACD